ncbi:hypothetical protein NPIL_41251 [Nephila pilipes]|uniref:Uncharacterized protein n=1 Tax=Nephila pilipes TaxID=299642 RepID=A0A8X6QD35_NEPPI|nr:hypothetical protein NPIL_41251 [Nephila pilipes]
MKELSDFFGSKISDRIINGKLKIFPETSDQHGKIQNYLSVKKLKSHTFEMQQDEQLKVIIRSLPAYYDQNELLTEILVHGPQPQHISILRNITNNNPMSLFLVVLN